MKRFTIVIALSCAFAISAVGGDCGKKTTETLAHSSESEIIHAGDVRALRGRVLYPDGKEAELMIVEVYRIDLATPVLEITYAQVDEVVRSGRLAAVDTGTSGKFCFKNLKAGNYMLRANISGERIGLSQFRMMNIFVTLTPTSKSAQRELKVQLGMAI
ncbi:MAG TPA: hypothetical protein VN920_02785 [Pyrinomonadaceae bacterium]|nr:hypothetical protein [Pyrinomonadaceae bacterium]